MPHPIPPGGTRATLYAAVARARLDDADCLLSRNRVDGAVYLAGYAIECCLKRAVCLRTGSHNLPASEEVHSWDRLVEAARLWPLLKAQPAVFAIYSSLADRWRPFRWGSGFRYRVRLFDASEAARLYKQVRQLYYSLIEMLA